MNQRAPELVKREFGWGGLKSPPLFFARNILLSLIILGL